MRHGGGAVRQGDVNGAAAARGVILAATGEQYVRMAAAAATSLKTAAPDLPIALFTDADAAAGPFDQVVRLADPWRRSKIDAMIDAPFERTLFIDADVFVLTDVSDVFELLDRFDIALAHDQERNSPHGGATWRRPFPACFPQFNSGVVAFRRTEPVLALLRRWREVVRAEDHRRDQPALRELLWESDLRIATLPPEYNQMALTELFYMRAEMLAPRILHHYKIHGAGKGAQAHATAGGLLGPGAAAALGAMLGRDRFVAAGEERPLGKLSPVRKRLLQARIALDAVLAAIRERTPGA